MELIINLQGFMKNMLNNQINLSGGKPSYSLKLKNAFKSIGLIVN